MKQYPSYKESGVDWLGKVPDHWESRRLGHYFNELREKVSDKDFSPLSVTMQGIVPQIETAAKTDDNDNRKRVSIGDFVINSRSDRKGSSGISHLDGSVSLISTVLRPSEAVYGPFIHHLFRSVNFQEEYYRYGKGIVADLWSTNYGEMRNITLAMPPLDEQRMIAAFLDRETAKIDALVAEQRRLVELLKEKRQSVISHAVTKGLNPNAKLRFSGIDWLGEVPEHWSTPPLYVRYNQSLGKMLDQGKMTGLHPTPYLRNQDVRWDYINSDDLPTMDITPKERERFTVRRGDILMVEGRELGRCAIWQGENGLIGFQKALHRLRPLDGTEHTRFFYYMMIFVNGTGAFVANTSPDEIPHLTGEELRRYRFPKPPYAEQADISDFLDAETSKFDALTAEAERSIELLLERRTALISAAVTGKIDVRELQAEHERRSARFIEDDSETHITITPPLSA